ncbi:hypothetical protein BU14_0546s0012 [Porphyra umbilicalis]|uniref:Uncharacterized protein n=1 Tax=Porphyra umbilicalis TaxID=2786 RepID=A0A1X6NS07_PORUM|nr:hypothetical protein BU14_0546s0012 [Porphyra umbilicalis]|eukprot:OSX71372.1 hypothetical protein BU14_0546s0012 [Porphyra umbilicalis]
MLNVSCSTCLVQLVLSATSFAQVADRVSIVGGCVPRRRRSGGARVGRQAPKGAPACATEGGLRLDEADAAARLVWLCGGRGGDRLRCKRCRGVPVGAVCRSVRRGTTVIEKNKKETALARAGHDKRSQTIPPHLMQADGCACYAGQPPPRRGAPPPPPPPLPLSRGPRTPLPAPGAYPHTRSCTRHTRFARRGPTRHKCTRCTAASSRGRRPRRVRPTGACRRPRRWQRWARRQRRQRLTRRPRRRTSRRTRRTGQRRPTRRTRRTARRTTGTGRGWGRRRPRRRRRGGQRRPRRPTG